MKNNAIIGPRVLNTLNYAPEVVDYEMPLPGSLTVPNQCLSVRQIVERFSRGMPVMMKNYDSDYDEDNMLPDPRILDLAERQELVENIDQHLNDFYEKQEKAQKDLDTDKSVP